MAENSTLSDVPPVQGAPRSLLLRRLGVGALALVVLAGVLGLLGDRTGKAQGPSGDGQSLRVEHAQVARLGMDVPFEMTVADPEGLDPQVTLAVTADYVDLFETHGWYPEPAEWSRTGEWLFLTFDTEESTEMTVVADAYLSPAAGTGDSGQVAVVVEGEPVNPVSFRTWILP